MPIADIETTEPCTAEPPSFYDSPDDVDVLGFLIVLAKRKRLIVTVMLSFGAVAAMVALLLPNRYTARATIMPPQQTQSTASMLMSQLAGSGVPSLASLAAKDLGLKNVNDLYVGMLKSRTVEDALISQFNLQQVYREKKLSDSRKTLESASDVVSDKDGLIEISFEDRDPQRAAAVANAYVEELRKLTQHLAVTEASQRRLFFEQQLQQAKDDLATAEVALKETQQQTGIIQLEGQARAIIEAVSRLRAQIAAKEVELKALRSFATDRNPDVIIAEQQLAGLRVQLARLEKEQASAGNDPIMATAKVPAAALDYVRRFREVKYREQVFELLAKQFEAAKLDEAKHAAVIQVVDAAVVPDKKSSPKRAIIVLIAAALGLLVGIVWAVTAEGLLRARANHRISHQLSELRAYMGLKSLHGVAAD